MMDIVNGNLDFTITKPRDSQLIVSIQEFRVWKLLDVILGVIILSVGLISRSNDVGAMDFVYFSFTLGMNLLQIFVF